MIAVSTDELETQKKFRDSLKAPYHFVADSSAFLVNLFDVKMFLFTIARRVTFVVGPGLKVLAIQEGNDAIDPSSSVKACSIKPPEALKFVTGDSPPPAFVAPEKFARDGGT